MKNQISLEGFIAGGGEKMFATMLLETKDDVETLAYYVAEKIKPYTNQLSKKQRKNKLKDGMVVSTHLNNVTMRIYAKEVNEGETITLKQLKEEKANELKGDLDIYVEWKMTPINEMVYETINFSIGDVNLEKLFFDKYKGKSAFIEIEFDEK